MSLGEELDNWKLNTSTGFGKQVNSTCPQHSRVLRAGPADRDASTRNSPSISVVLKDDNTPGIWMSLNPIALRLNVRACQVTD